MLGILCPLPGTAPSPALCALGWGLACACWVFGALNSGWHLCAKQPLSICAPLLSQGCSRGQSEENTQGTERGFSGSSH